MIHFRLMTGNDIPAGLSLCRAAGWNQTADDWLHFLALSPDGCWVALHDEIGIVGTVATLPYEDRFRWIGMVLVDPAQQRKGIGTQLVRHVLRDDQTFKLDATPAGRQVYLQLGFVDEYRISRMQLSRVRADMIPGTTARPVRPADLPSLMEIDREVFGADRRSLLEAVFRRSPRLAWLMEDGDEVQAYCLGRIGHNFAHIGPVIGRNVESARDVACAALRAADGQPVVMDALCHTPEWLAWLEQIGFSEQRPLIRMYRGTNAFPGTPAMQFAVLGPEFG